MKNDVLNCFGVNIKFQNLSRNLLKVSANYSHAVATEIM